MSTLDGMSDDYNISTSGDWSENMWSDGPSSNKETPEQRLNRVLGEFDIEDIEKYVRAKKLEKLKDSMKIKIVR